MTVHHSEVQRRLEVALAAGRQAGRSTLDFFQHDALAVERKADNSPVTAADRRAEQLLRDAILGSFPDDGIVGEEFGEHAGRSGFRWILDPIDGTKSFISGVPLYGTMVGVEHLQEPLIGVVAIPALDECVYAARGQGAWYLKGDLSPRPARVSTRTRLADGLFLTSQVDSFWARGAAEAYWKKRPTSRAPGGTAMATCWSPQGGRRRWSTRS
jgi:histidinol-phosphatase